MSDERALVLPADTVLVPVDSLAEELRAILPHEPGDFALSRPGRRAGSKAIGRDLADLLERFRTPTTITEAVIDCARRSGADPVAMLEDAYPVLRRLVAERFLTAPDSPDAEELAPTLREPIGPFEVVRCVRLIDDSEIHHARRRDGQLAAVKILRPGAPEALRHLLLREGQILANLAVPAAPRLLERGEIDGRPWLAIEWIEGVSVGVHAARIRTLPPPERRTAQLRLVHAVLRAYETLHHAGLVHGDVHPGNVLVSDSLRVTVIDFALARFPAAAGLLADAPRGAVGQYWEPEFARAMLASEAWPRTTIWGEQYAIGALLYFLCAGHHYLPFSAETEQALRQVEREQPSPFAEPWPELEHVLRRALHKDPAQRFPDLRAMREALPSLQPPSARRPRLGALSQRVSVSLQPRGTLDVDGFPKAPRSSLNFGACGAAYVAYRTAVVREDAASLARADVWLGRAERRCRDADAFYDADEFKRADLGDVSPYHTALGVHATRLLVARAMCDDAAEEAARIRMLAHAARGTSALDLTLGRSGVVLALAIAYEARPDTRVRDMGNSILAGIWPALASLPPIAEDRDVGYLGIAHGWGGLIYSALVWSAATGAPLPPELGERAEQLLACAEADGPALRLPVLSPSHPNRSQTTPWMAGWCHGAAGHVFWLVLAHRLLGDAKFLDTARRVARSAVHSTERVGNLCCGLAGRAYAMLCLARETGEPEWLSHAEQLADAAADGELLNRWPQSLYKGELGLVLLDAELDHPLAARMPFFELDPPPGRGP